MHDVEIIGLIVGFVQVEGADFFVMRSMVVFSEIVRPVEGSFLPENVELALLCSVSYPIKMHVNCFGSFLFYGVVCNSDGGGIVGADGSGRLRMTKFFQGAS